MNTATRLAIVGGLSLSASGLPLHAGTAVQQSAGPGGLAANAGAEPTALFPVSGSAFPN